MAPSRALLSPVSICASCARNTIYVQRSFSTIFPRHTAESRLPRVANPSLWQSLLPKAFRRQGPSMPTDRPTTPARMKERNPFTIYIVLALLVGSNAIQLITLRNEMLNFSRKTDAKLALLREVVQRVKNGEEVDVEKLLGSGDPKQEQEWEEVVEELEETDMLEEGRKKREAKHEEKMEKRRVADEEKRLAREREAQVDVDGAEGEAQARRPKFM